MIILTIVYDNFLFNILLSLGVFFFVYGIASYCAIKGTDRKIDSAWLKIQGKLCTDLERLIINEKQLRNLDTAFKLLILIEALQVIKKIFAEESDDLEIPAVTKRKEAKQAVCIAIEKLKAAIQLDLNLVLN